MHKAVDFSDVQGLVRFGFGKMTEAIYFLLRIRDPIAARTWLARAQFTSAIEMNPPPSTAMQIAFSCQGLEALGVPPRIIAGFSFEFLEGMAGDANRSRRLGDVGANDPKNWRWGVGAHVPHVVLMLFAEPGRLDEFEQSTKQTLWRDAFDEIISPLGTSDLGGREPFGFIDGISQPVLDWAQGREPSVNCDQLTYGNVVCLGEFLLGYPNEYGRYTDRPLLDAADTTAAELPDADDHPGKKDLGKNGSYLVMRQLAQNVRAFWQYMGQAGQATGAKADAIAESMVGRRRQDGAPLQSPARTVIPGVGDTGNNAQRQRDTTLNRFTFDSDPEGVQCPLGAHVRRANPRTSDLPGNPSGLLSRLIHMLGYGSTDIREDLVASVRFHRLLRRGREYGPSLSPEEAVEPGPPNEPERGLHFIAVNANIERQFEFVQNAWMASQKFDGLTEESDALIGNREPVKGCLFANSFSVPQTNRVLTRLTGVPRFVTVRGGAYLFLPGIRALKFLSGLRV